MIKSLILTTCSIAIWIIAAYLTYSYNRPHNYELSRTLKYTIIFGSLQGLSKSLIRPLGQSLISKKPSWSRELWKAKIDRFGAAVFKFFCNPIGLITLFCILKGEAYLPSFLGGLGSLNSMWVSNTWGKPQLDAQSIRFIHASVGFVLSDLVLHLVYERKRPDFAEVLLHLTISLIFLWYSVVDDYTRVASLILLIHMACDTVVYAAKALVDTRLSGGAFAYLPLLVVHVWFRLYAFSQVLRSIVVDAPKAVNVNNVWAFLSTLLSLSLLMQTFWGFVILKIGLLLLSTGQSRDLQANLSSMDLKALNTKKKL
jgi:TLC domain